MVKNDVRRTGAVAFAFDVMSGICIGVAFIIPGFSGGSVAAILGIYERLISAIADILKDFKSSIKTLLPIGLGMIVGIISLLYPLSWALSEFPIPTVSLFVGLAIGGLPSITDKLKGEKIKYSTFVSFLVAMLLVISISFMPISTDRDLFSLNAGGYILLFLIGILGSSALVIPGISGSMLLLILGYYNPIVSLVTEHLFLGKDIGTSIIVLMITGIGVVVGFVGISVVMKKLFAKCPKATYAAIFGFIIGSVPTIFVSAAKEANMTFSTLPTSPFYWIFSALLLIFGVAVTYTLVIYSRKRIKSNV